ncbi:MAG TPA: hypothetical protein PKN99_12750 [Cyclobacteriaceae bacterium]|nr:hypothetical protein [Cyclobacteriaceae bacterium]
MNYCFYILILFSLQQLYFPLQAQLAKDSTSLIKPDSTVVARLNQLDSIRQETEADYSNFKNKYDSINQSANTTQAKLQSKIDSLTTLNLPTVDLSHKLDSTKEARTSKLKELESKWEDTKSKHTSAITDLNLPPPWDQGQQSLVAATSKLDIRLPIPEANLPSLSLDQGLNIDLPGVDNPIQDLGINSPSLSELKPKELNQLEGYTQDVKAIKEGEVDEVIDNQLQNVEGVGELQAQQNQMKMPSLDQAKAKQQYLQMAKLSAKEHFAGKFDQVDNAMGNMSKLKKKYSSVQSVKNLPKRKPNEMKEKPFVERLVPAFNLQLMQRNVWMLDVNPSLGYRFNPHFSTGIGWVQRWSYNFDSNEYAYEERMYGPRVYGEYELKQGFALTLEADYVNALVRTLFDDPIGREWVGNLKAGIKKQYRISKKINGNIQALYNVIDPDKRSPYPRFNIRIGFDFGLKKRVKEEQSDVNQ